MLKKMAALNAMLNTDSAPPLIFIYSLLILYYYFNYFLITVFVGYVQQIYA
jgi:hypothetical protein